MVEPSKTGLLPDAADIRGTFASDENGIFNRQLAEDSQQKQEDQPAEERKLPQAAMATK